MARKNRLGESLVELGLITRAQLDEALNKCESSGQRIGEALVSLGYLTERDLWKTLAQDADVPFLEPAELRVDPMVVSLVAPAVARGQKVMPLRNEGRALLVVMSNPFDIGVVRSLERTTGRQIRVAASDPGEIGALIESYYGNGSAPAPVVDKDASSRARAGWTQRGDGANRAATSQVSIGEPAAAPATAAGQPRQMTTVDEGATAAELADSIIRRGVALEATDIHIEPMEDAVLVRYRVDGLLQDGPIYPKGLQASLMSRVKIISNLDIAEMRMPQDGRVRLRVNGRPIDLRVSTFPTVHGEDIVLRILDRGRVNLRLDHLGIDPADVALLREALAKPYGMMPVTGPTGSGKTTTLYSALVEMNRGDRCIITLEDPVEYEMEHIRQSQINVRAGLTFASGLRSVLRHDPDIILVGEMRDAETVQIALTAALTGHLVLTTLHTTTAAGAIPRLLDMGAEPFIVASALSLIAGQRLVRTLCQVCREELALPQSVRDRFDLRGATVYGPKRMWRVPQHGLPGPDGHLRVFADHRRNRLLHI